MSTVLIAGAGYVGAALARELLALEGRSPESGLRLVLVRRHPEALPATLREHPRVSTLAADLSDRRSVEAQLRPYRDDITRIAYTTAAGGRSVERYRAAYVDGVVHLADALGSSPSRFVYTSSTAVYGDHGGATVDEGTPLSPEALSETARELIRGEAEVHARFKTAGVVLRLGGIYGPTRTRLIDQVRAGEAQVPRGSTITNRIHRDDCAGALAHLLFSAEVAPIYVGVDEEPAEYADVIRFLATLTGAPPPRLAEADAAPSRAGSKRCDGSLLRAHGYRYRYPSFREGYAAMLAEDQLS